MRLIDADRMATNELVAFILAQAMTTDAADRDINSIVHEKIQRLIADTPTVEDAVQEWISVDDRSPEEKVNCIVHYRHDYCDNDDYWAIGICFYDGEKFQINPAYKVTHWMPMPLAPEVKND